ncbi:MAG: class I SAM-dependent methyltransferase [Desulfovibrionaceae bacterium]|nr:class I SAM-dependent methyltransferase [Desulfovibrionaceae bacterium]
MKYPTFELINSISRKFSAKTYLEIGVRSGETFFKVDLPCKTAVDPNFLFKIEDHANPRSYYFPSTSDKFFSSFPELQKNQFYGATSTDFKFDIIYIDGLHTYEQSYRDFLNSIPYSHENTIWIFDDTLPWDPFTAHPDYSISLKYRALFNITGRPWHGDVYKTIFAIHEFHLNFSYATHIDYGNQQTIVWKTKQNATRRQYGKEEFIKSMTIFDLYENISAINPMSVDNVLAVIGKRIDDDSFSYIDISRAIIKLTTFSETSLKNDNFLHKDELNNKFEYINLKIENLEKELNTIRCQFTERVCETSKIEQNLASYNKFFDKIIDKIDSFSEVLSLLQLKNNYITHFLKVYICITAIVFVVFILLLLLYV